LAFLGAASTGAAWKIGTGIAAAFFARLGVSVTSAAGVSTRSAVESALSDFLLDFLTARLRGDFGSIAMAPNPLARIPDFWSYAFSWFADEIHLRTKPLL
jgi:hypothetical protein